MIRDALARLAYGAVCVELVGEPGIGKTMMLTQLRDLAGPTHALMLGGRASEFEHDLPFGTFIDALDEHLETYGDRWSRTLGEDVAAELAAIFPALRPRGAASVGHASSSERFRAHRAVRALLEHLALSHPLVLALDDVHWADSSSVELIGALLRHPPAAPVLLALAHRQHQAPERLVRELTVGVRDGIVQRIELGPLSWSEACGLLKTGTPGRERERLFRESGGNPFYLHQLARATARGVARGDLGAGVPRSVVASLFSELDGVTSGARHLAGAAAVAGDPFDLDLASQIGELDRATALVHLDELVTAGLLNPSGAPLRFAFRHPLVRRAVYESTPPGWRIGAHHRANDVMTQRGVSAAARAHHVEQSAEVGDQAAIDALVAAAAQAIVPAASARWLKAAVRLAPEGDAQQLGLLCGLGEALAGAGMLEESQTVLLAALERWPEGGDPAHRAGLIVLCTTIDRLLGRLEEADARLAAAHGEIDDPCSEAGVALAIELTAVRMFSNDFRSARDAAAEAVRRAEALGDPVLLAAAVAGAGFANFCGGAADVARTRVAEASRLIAQVDDAALARRPDIFFNLGWAERYLDRYEASVSHFGRGLAVARATGHSQLYVELSAGRASALILWGRITDALACNQEAIEAARLSESPHPLAWALMINCFMQIDSGDLGEAIRDGREAVALAADYSIVSALCRVSLGMALAERGNARQALELIVEGGGGRTLPRILPLMRPFILEAMTRADIAAGNMTDAAACAAQARALVDGVRCDLPRAMAERATANVLFAEGELEAASESALISAARAEAVEAMVEASRSRLLAGRALAAAGRRKDAGDELQAAEATFGACGAKRLREECVRELRRIGRRVARAGVRADATSRGTAALSGREMEVARLVHDRHTNREIATRLFISEKTVESHLRNVFVKLGVTTRADVARAIDTPRSSNE